MHTISSIKLPPVYGQRQILADAFSPAKSPDEARMTDLLRVALEDRAGLDERLKGYLAKWNITAKQKGKLAQLFGWDDFADLPPHKRRPAYSTNAANNSAWFAHVAYLIREFHRLSQARPIQFYMLTLVHLDWNFGDKLTTIDWIKIKKKATRALETIGVDGVAVLEFQAMTNEKHGDDGRLMMPNVHAIVWAKDGRPFDHRKAQKRLCKTFKGKGNAKGAVIKPVSEAEGGVIGAVAYMTKSITSGKWRKFLPDGEECQINTTKHYRNNQRLRVMEILSHFKHSQLIFGRGEGTKVRQAALKAARDKQPKDWVEIENVPKLWRKVRHKAGKAEFMVVSVLRGN